ncbi:MULTISPECIES: DUF1330 domain-containing protein [unclassified Yimella]|uniref:DUF1330 domain-containing protein n=1 Tax=unclassified Yimella TaxID=2649892 RepID=UPI00101D4B74|nr:MULTISPECIES: DUF1330 domain-containing protein [unclassified Yimella]MCG8654335.1 DUF1330 domain-containing protein [Yimella sp. NH-Cas1]RYG78252.1 DUF1330 domain-containing protein [Yimella sp. RIT 621]
MSKGYWIAHISVHDPDGYTQYTDRNGAVYAKYGGRLLVRGGTFEAVEGKARDRNVVVEYPSYEAALAAYHSPEYAEAKKYRQASSDGELLVIEGYDGPQPGE